jgi:hypothetical protein
VPQPEGGDKLKGRRRSARIRPCPTESLDHGENIFHPADADHKRQHQQPGDEGGSKVNGMPRLPNDGDYAEDYT